MWFLHINKITNKILFKRIFGIWKKWGFFWVNFQDIILKWKRVVLATINLHNLIRISNFISDDFAKIMAQIETDTNKMETLNTVDGN